MGEGLKRALAAAKATHGKGHVAASKRCIYKFHVNCGRGNYLDGTFTAEPEDIAFAIGKTVYFSEPWGKHSGVEVTFDASMFTVKSNSVSDAQAFDRLNLASGDCPLGLLADMIGDGVVGLTAEEIRTAPTFFRKAIERIAE